MKVYKLLLIVVLGSFGINARSQPTDHSVLMSQGTWKQIVGYFAKSSKIDGDWLPSAMDLSGLESRLSQISQMKSEGPIKGLQVDHPEHSYRQYVAIIVSGRKLIFVSAFPGDIQPPQIWLKELIDVSDGGASVWRVLYDPATGKFEHLSTNGVG